MFITLSSQTLLTNPCMPCIPSSFLTLSSIPQGMSPLFPKLMSLRAVSPHLKFSQSPLFFFLFHFLHYWFLSSLQTPPCFDWFCGSALNISLLILLPAFFLIFNLRRKLGACENLCSGRKLKGKHTNKTMKGNTYLHYALPPPHFFSIFLLFIHLPPS